MAVLVALAVDAAGSPAAAVPAAAPRETALADALAALKILSRERVGLGPFQSAPVRARGRGHERGGWVREPAHARGVWVRAHPSRAIPQALAAYQQLATGYAGRPAGDEALRVLVNAVHSSPAAQAAFIDTGGLVRLLALLAQPLPPTTVFLTSRVLFLLMASAPAALSALVAATPETVPTLVTAAARVRPVPDGQAAAAEVLRVLHCVAARSPEAMASSVEGLSSIVAETLVAPPAPAAPDDELIAAASHLLVPLTDAQVRAIVDAAYALERATPASGTLADQLLGLLSRLISHAGRDLCVVAAAQRACTQSTLTCRGA